MPSVDLSTHSDSWEFKLSAAVYEAEGSHDHVEYPACIRLCPAIPNHIAYFFCSCFSRMLWWTNSARNSVRSRRRKSWIGTRSTTEPWKTSCLVSVPFSPSPANSEPMPDILFVVTQTWRTSPIGGQMRCGEANARKWNQTCKLLQRSSPTHASS